MQGIMERKELATEYLVCTQKRHRVSASFMNLLPILLPYRMSLPGTELLRMGELKKYRHQLGPLRGYVSTVVGLLLQL